MKRMSINGSHRGKAQALVELPIVLWVLILLLTIPLIDLTTFSLRYNFLLVASRDAAYSASRSRTFVQDVSANELSAVHTASQVASQVAARFPEITINSVNTYIVITRLSNGNTSKQSTALTTPADTSTFAYQIETVINGSTNPILKVDNSYWPTVPGLTAPIPVSIASKAYAENPQGLNQ